MSALLRIRLGFDALLMIGRRIEKTAQNPVLAALVGLFSILVLRHA